MRTFLAIVVSGMLAVGAAQAQLPPPEQPRPEPHQPGGAPPPDERDRDMPPPPKHWGQRDKPSWERHVRLCRERYRSYNPRTDRYVIRRGKTALCRL